MNENINYNIRVGVVGNAELVKFQRSIDKVNATARRSEAELKKMSSGMTGLASVAKSLAVTLASVFSVSLVRNALDYGDAIQKASLKLGLSTDAFQELRYAAELSGIEMSAFSQGIQRFTRRSAEAAQGTGELAKVFKQLGIDTRDAAGNLKSSEALLGEYADAIQNAAGSGEQLRLAFKAFDSEGAGLVNLLRDGSEGLEAFRQAARDAGVILSKDLVDQSAALNDKITKLSGNLRVLLYPAFIGIASVAIDVAAGLRTVAEWVGNLPDWAAWAAGAAAVSVALLNLRKVLLALTFGNPITAIVGAFVIGAAVIVENWEKVSAWFQYRLPAIVAAGEKEMLLLGVKVKTALLPIVGIFDDVFTDAVNVAIDAINYLTGKIADVFALNAQVVSVLAPVIPGGLLLERAADAAAGYAENLREALPYVGQLTDAQGALGENIRASNEAAAQAAELAALYGIQYQEALALISEASANSAAAVDEFATAIDGMNAAAGSAGGGSGGGSSLQKLKTEMDEIAEAAKTVGSEVGDAFANKFPDVVRSALDGTKKIGDAFSDMVKNIALDIAALLVSQQIKQFLGLLGGAVPALGSLAGFAQQPTVAAGGASLSGGAAGPVSVNIVNNSAAQVSARPVQNAGGTSVEVLVQQEVARAVSSGAIDQQFRQAFGLRRIPAS